MNIFAVDTDPRVAARALCDQHVVKMLTESAQILSSAHSVRGHLTEVLVGDRCSPAVAYDAPYTLACLNHPCCAWVRESHANYAWLMAHAAELAAEFEHRFKHDRHNAIGAVDWLAVNKPILPDVGLTEHPKVVPDRFKSMPVVEAYRAFYREDKTFARWTRDPARRPVWL